MHKCFEDLKKELEEKGYYDSIIPVITSFTTGQTKPYFSIKYKKKNKDGTLTKKRYTIDIVMNYCPICGEPLEEKN